MRPLFIPLNTEFYEAFVRGDKDSEYRVYGPRWNERTCFVGRPVVISKGYGKASRMAGKVAQFDRVPATSLGGLNRIALIRLYGRLDMDIAAILIDLDRAESPSSE